MRRLLALLPLALLAAACRTEPSKPDDTGMNEECTWYRDADGDGYGDATIAAEGCAPDVGWVEDASDCDDANSDINPAADERCNGYDDDCDGLIDDEDPSVVDAGTWFEDADGDAYGDDAITTLACEQPEGFAAYGGDCDDTDPAYNPGATEDDCADPNDYN
jgi:hypothetical protein